MRAAFCAASAATIVFGLAMQVHAAAGTEIVASSGSPAFVSPASPEGAGDLVNDPARTTGWNDWFSGWPSDVNHYGYQITSMADVNRLVRKLAAVKGGLRQIRLAPMKEPRGLGWVTSLPEGNDVPVLFSLGDQQRVNRWFRRLPDGKVGVMQFENTFGVMLFEKTFGVMQFEKTPVAVPPTLTLFVQNEAIDLDQLEIPKGVEVSAGYAPRHFHQLNLRRATEVEQQQPSEAIARPMDAAAQKALDEIIEYLALQKELVKEQPEK